MDANITSTNGFEARGPHYEALSERARVEASSSRSPFLERPDKRELQGLHKDPFARRFTISSVFYKPELGGLEPLYQQKSAEAIGVIQKALQAKDFFKTFDEFLKFSAKERQSVQEQILASDSFKKLVESSNPDLQEKIEDLKNSVAKITEPRTSEISSIKSFENLPEAYQERFKDFPNEGKFHQISEFIAGEHIPLTSRSLEETVQLGPFLQLDKIPTGVIEHTSVEHFDSIKTYLEELFEEYRDAESKSKKTLELIFEIYWWLTNATFFQAESESTADYVLAALLLNKGFDQFEVKPNVNLALEAYLADNVDFLTYLKDGEYFTQSLITKVKRAA